MVEFQFNLTESKQLAVSKVRLFICFIKCNRKGIIAQMTCPFFLYFMIWTLLQSYYYLTIDALLSLFFSPFWLD